MGHSFWSDMAMDKMQGRPKSKGKRGKKEKKQKWNSFTVGMRARHLRWKTKYL
jgi:hypothetical protein